MPSLIELVVGRKEALRNDAEKIAGIHGAGTVVELARNPEWRSAEDEGIEICRLLHELSEPCLCPFEERLLQEQVFAGIGRKA